MHMDSSMSCGFKEQRCPTAETSLLCLTSRNKVKDLVRGMTHVYLRGRGGVERLQFTFANIWIAKIGGIEINFSLCTQKVLLRSYVHKNATGLFPRKCVFVHVCACVCVHVCVMFCWYKILVLYSLA